jgi:proteic killer suppression protein
MYFMIRSFVDETTRDLFDGRNSKAARRVPNEIWRIAQRKLKQLDLVRRVTEMDVPPSNRLKRLRGDQSGRYSVRVNDQYRITFRWEGTDAYEVCCEDYH